MNLGMPEMIFIFLLALIIFGPKKLPEIGRQVGKFMAEFKRASNEFKYQFEDELRQLELQDHAKKFEDSLKSTVGLNDEPSSTSAATADPAATPAVQEELSILPPPKSTVASSYGTYPMATYSYEAPKPNGRSHVALLPNEIEDESAGPAVNAEGNNA